MSQADWMAKLEWMRSGGVDEAEWDNNGFLLRAKLGSDPRPSSATPMPMRDAVSDRRATLLGATSRLVKVDGK